MTLVRTKPINVANLIGNVVACVIKASLVRGFIRVSLPKNPIPMEEI